MVELKRVKRQLAPLQASVWVRDVTEQGVEPHPGPSLYSANVSCFGKHGLELLENARAAKVPVVCMQEHNLTQQ